MRLLFILILLFAPSFGCNETVSKKQDNQMEKDSEAAVRFVEDQANQKVDVYFGASFFTSYWYTDAYYKPVLYP